MSSKALVSFSLIFVIITIGEILSGQSTSYEHLHYVFKPAIVVSLILFFWFHSKTIDHKLRTFVLCALLFSLCGDILLMFVEVSPNYFLFGLISFLIAHVLYVLAFKLQRNKKVNAYGFVILLIAYASGLFYVLLDGLNDMMIPVMIYMLVILSMATTAYLRKGIVNRISYLMVLLGALLFLISDSILALNKFYQPQQYANITIMTTYALAQFLIVIGILKLSVKQQL